MDPATISALRDLGVSGVAIVSLALALRARHQIHRHEINCEMAKMLTDVRALLREIRDALKARG